jgi:hypothetical protein
MVNKRFERQAVYWTRNVSFKTRNGLSPALADRLQRVIAPPGAAKGAMDLEASSHTFLEATRR